MELIFDIIFSALVAISLFLCASIIGSFLEWNLGFMKIMFTSWVSIRLQIMIAVVVFIKIRFLPF